MIVTRVFHIFMKIANANVENRKKMKNKSIKNVCLVIISILLHILEYLTHVLKISGIRREDQERNRQLDNERERETEREQERERDQERERERDRETEREREKEQERERERGKRERERESREQEKRKKDQEYEEEQTKRREREREEEEYTANQKKKLMEEEEEESKKLAARKREEESKIAARKKVDDSKVSDDNKPSGHKTTQKESEQERQKKRAENEKKRKIQRVEESNSNKSEDWSAIAGDVADKAINDIRNHVENESDDEDNIGLENSQSTDAEKPSKSFEPTDLDENNDEGDKTMNIINSEQADATNEETNEPENIILPDSGESNQAKCDVGKYLEKSSIDVVCNMNELETTQNDEIKEKCGIFDEHTEAITICSNHSSELAEAKFKKKYGPRGVTCHNKDHFKAAPQTSRTWKSTKPRRSRIVSKNKSKTWMMALDNLIPAGSVVCHKCADFLDAEVEKINNPVQDVSQEEEIEDPSYEDTPGPSKKYEIQGSFEDISPEKKFHVLEHITENIRKSLREVSADPEVQKAVYKTIIDSKRVEKDIGAPIKPSALEKEVFNAIKMEDSLDERRALVTGLTKTMSLETLNMIEDSPRIGRKLYRSATNLRNKERRSFKAGEKPRREKLKQERAQRLVNFFTSKENIEPAAFGVKTYTDSKKKMRMAPDVTKNARDNVLIKRAMAFEKELGEEKPLSETTLRRILKQLDGKTQKAREGVNPYKSHANESIKEMYNAVDILGENGGFESDQQQKDFKEAFEIAEEYVHNYFQYEVENNADCESHCLECGLSKNGSNNCTKDHQNNRCDQCDDIEILLESFDKLLEDGKEELDKIDQCKYEQLKYSIENAKDNITAYKANIMQDVNQNREWQKLLTDDGETALVVFDWSMKMLDKFYRKPTDKHYGEKGRSVHMSTFVTKKDDVKELQAIPFILEGKDVTQNTETVLPILESTLALYSQGNPNIKEIHIKSDRAGCYTSEKLPKFLYEIKDKYNFEIKSLVHNAAGCGKDTCDSRSGLIKGIVTDAVEAYKMDVDSSQKLAESIVKAKDPANTIVVLGQVQVQDEELKRMKEEKKDLTNVRDHHLYKFEKDGMRIFDFSNISEGKFVKDEDITPMNYQAEFKGKIIHHNGEIEFENSGMKEEDCLPKNRIIASVKESEPQVISKSDTKEGKRDDQVYFDCPERACIRSFSRYQDREIHKASGKCQIKVKDVSTEEQIKVMFYERLGNSGYDYHTTLGGTLVTHLNELERSKISNYVPPEEKAKILEKKFKTGFGRTKYKGGRLDKDAKAFVTEEFNAGAATGKHRTSESVFNRMQELKNPDGSPMFTHKQYLSNQQISSLFTKLSAEQKKAKVPNKTKPSSSKASTSKNEPSTSTSSQDDQEEEEDQEEELVNDVIKLIEADEESDDEEDGNPSKKQRVEELEKPPPPPFVGLDLQRFILLSLILMSSIQCFRMIVSPFVK